MHSKPLLKVLDKHVPVKKKYVRANDKPFMTRSLRKTVMLRSRLRNRYNKNQTVENWNNFRKQRNSCVKVHMKRNFLFSVLIELFVLISMVQSVFSSAVWFWRYEAPEVAVPPKRGQTVAYQTPVTLQVCQFSKASLKGQRILQ